MFGREENYLSFPSIVFLLLPLVLFIWKKLTSQCFNIPPGPTPWPIVGNLVQMGKKTHSHITFAHFAKAYGPLISLREGTRLAVVASSPAAATEILKTHDRQFSFRFIPDKSSDSNPDPFSMASLVWAPECSGQWKVLRSLCRSELFSPKAIDSQANLRRTKLGEMVNFLECKEGQVVQIKDVVFTTVFNTLSTLFFSKDLVRFQDGEEESSGLKDHFKELAELAGKPNIADFYPILERLDLQGIKKTTIKCVMQIYSEWQHIIKERRVGRGNNSPSRGRDFLDAMLENKFADYQINQLIIELYNAGADTTTTVVEWTMAEMLKNREAMEKVREELRREFDQDSNISESVVSQLPYLNACFKETLRLHPPAPFLLPHCASETCKVMEYTVPKNSRVIVNFWAIGHDPEIWEDPFKFKPERFIGSELDYKGHDYEYLPFGAGRRSCPGQPLGSKQAPLILAYLLHCFDWSVPNNSPIDTSERLILSLEMVHPLKLIPKRRF
ncbi:probable (S)-N-methylcoclaurine 3'-hydroxylase isozyme 2 [Ziziphus jujuba]|uniref:Probable (S)-N-methylcoclaurine 3'-hydroxylase isozyme 2 n=1 Tax=Ziziphus jujuba TaxID=326968 RepID=A0A6P6G0Z2_ZIZJJ|nr:probable (S)-N-methylcoclaurine 3'-hydroxylase isozyme 2 [Ziziphus jujuba]